MYGGLDEQVVNYPEVLLEDKGVNDAFGAAFIAAADKDELQLSRSSDGRYTAMSGTGGSETFSRRT